MNSYKNLQYKSLVLANTYELMTHLNNLSEEKDELSIILNDWLEVISELQSFVSLESIKLKIKFAFISYKPEQEKRALTDLLIKNHQLEVSKSDSYLISFQKLTILENIYSYFQDHLKAKEIRTKLFKLHQNKINIDENNLIQSWAKYLNNFHDKHEEFHKTWIQLDYFPFKSA